jgi:hypothetical protein
LEVNLEVGGNQSHSCLQWPWGTGGNLGGLLDIPMQILRYPKSKQEEISTLSNLTKNLPLKSSLGSEGRVREG